MTKDVLTLCAVCETKTPEFMASDGRLMCATCVRAKDLNVTRALRLGPYCCRDCGAMNVTKTPHRRGDDPDGTCRSLRWQTLPPEPLPPGPSEPAQQAKAA